MRKVRLLGFYLPQYHPTPENDKWWGKGFTEWTNVSKAKPLFPGHQQPHLPADLGFYDLRIPEVREAQADMARRAGVEGFCYWHYWFAGKRLLERPFNEVVASGKPDLPFCLGWANHTWSSHWIGAEHRTLIEQTYPGPDDHERHFYTVLPAFLDKRYVRVNNRPMFTIFRPKEIPHAQAYIEQWQNLARRNGLDGIHFVAHLFDNDLDFPWRTMGYSGAVVTNELKLMRRRLGDIVRERVRRVKTKKPTFGRLQTWSDVAECAMRLVAHRTFQRLFRWPGGVHYYKDAILFMKSEQALAQGCYPSIVPGWDNTARAGRKGVVLQGANPELFYHHAREIIDSVAERPEEERFVFIKSWNEWAEGNYMEPNRTHGYGYINALRAALDADTSAQPTTLHATA